MQDSQNINLNIGFDAKRAFHNKAGLGNYSRNLLLALYQKYPALNYTLFNPQKEKELIFNCPEKMEERIFSGYGKIQRVKWRTYGITDEIERLGLDLYHGLSHELPVGVEKLRTKAIVSIHDLIFVRHPEWYHPIDRKIYVKKYQRSCHSADKIVAISQQTKNDLIDIWNIDPHKIEVVLQGCHPIYRETVSDETIETVKKKYQLPKDFIIAVGTIEKRKNQLNTLKAFDAANIDIPLFIIGRETKYVKQLRSFISSRKLKNITFLNDVKFNELPVFYNLAKMSVYPSIYEGFGIPVLESISAGTPVITTNRDCFKDAGGDAALYVDPYNHEALAEQIQLLLGDSSLYQQLVDAGKAHVKKFEPDRIAQNMMDVYQKTLKQ